ncbi:MAG TPA: ABC transporter permease [Gemmatimonadaceae bacterium]|nr:ABC transporter permease [Gemmatimonadaceae bacterium]
MKKSFRLTDVVPNARKDVDDELAFHLEMRTKEFMEQGLPADEARQRARESFGDVQRIVGDLRHERAERNSERGRRDWWIGLQSDIRYAFRSLRKNRAFAAAAIATLALGIGANSAIFSIVNNVLLRPLPFPTSERLAVLWGKYPNYGRANLSLPDFRDWRDQARSFEHVAARHSVAFNFTGGEEPVQLRGDRVTANFFAALGVQPMLGRAFRPEEEVGEHLVVILSHGFWQRQFGGDAGIVGSTVPLSGRPYTVVGVMPPHFRFAGDKDVWSPARTDTPTAHRRSEYLDAFGRLKPGVSIEQADTEIATIAQRLSVQYPGTNANFQSEVVSLHEDTVADVRPALLVFTGAVGLVLLIACANVANLLLARAAAREREIAVRSALGASRGRLVRQLLTESVLISVIGGGLGLLLAVWGIGALRSTNTSLLPRIGEVRVDLAVMGFSLLLSLVTGLLFGLAPALRMVSNRLHDSIKEGARGAAGGAVTRFRNSLVLAEVALAVVLLVGAGLLIRSFEKLNRVDPGFDPRGVLTYQAGFPAARYGQTSALPAVYDQLMERTRVIPGVRGVAVSNTLPTLGIGYASFAIENVPFPASDPNTGPIDVQPYTVSPDYFKVMGIRLTQGRGIESRDVDGAGDVAVINTEMVRRFIPAGRNPIGMRVTFGNPADTAGWWTIVGVADVVAQQGLAAKPYAQIYLPIAQAPRRSVYVTVKTDGDPMALVPSVRQALRSVDSEVPLSDVATMTERLSTDIAATRVSVTVLSIFAALAMVLAAIGIYGVLAYAVAQRTREIGIRMALGASAGVVRRLIVRQGMTPAIIGVAVGLAGAFYLTRLMEKLLFGVAPSDPATFAMVAIFLAMVAFLASFVPARRATRVAPTEALRYD